jgi:ABC-type glycerol-3-phosphate transport system substrate-binding protein
MHGSGVRSRQHVLRSLATAVLLCVLAISMPAAAKTQITFATGLSGSNLEVMKGRIKKFEEQNPDIAVEVLVFAGFTQVKEKLLTMLASGSAPDVVHTSLNDAGELINNGALMDVTEYTKQLNFNDYFFTDVYIRNGRVYGGLDTHAQVHPVYINTSMFANAGLPSPNQYHREGTWNWDTFSKVAKKLTIMDGAGKITQFGALMNSFHNKPP